MARPVNKPAAHVLCLSLLSAFSMTATLTGVMEFQCGVFIWISLVAKVAGHLSFIHCFCISSLESYLLVSFVISWLAYFLFLVVWVWFGLACLFVLWGLIFYLFIYSRHNNQSDVQLAKIFSGQDMLDLLYNWRQENHDQESECLSVYWWLLPTSHPESII